MPIRVQAAHIIHRVVYEEQSLQGLLNQAQHDIKDPRDSDFLYALCTGTIREYLSLEAVIDELLNKPLKAKDRDIKTVLIMGLFQLWHMNTPDYAAVNSSVDTAKALKKPWACGLINKLLRLAMTNKDKLLAKQNTLYAHPQWLLEEIKNAYPEHWESICEQNNSQAPMSLRVNTLLTTRDAYSKELTTVGIPHFLPDDPLDSDAICLEKPVKIAELPHFSKGMCYVQDLSAQRVGHLLHPKAGERILDACAAPGGKTTHILTLEPHIDVLVALDHNPSRLAKVTSNLNRLGLKEAHLKLALADAINTESWWDGQLFDRILLDVPCTGTGVIRRHPEIKLHRTPEDLQKLPQIQSHMLTKLWPLLKSGGTLIYTTCSILPHENDEVIRAFINHEKSAILDSLLIPDSIKTQYGKQLLPSKTHDGFYYARLIKE